MPTGLPEEVEEWLRDNPEVLVLVNKIRHESGTDEEAARALYYQGAEMLKLPKNMHDEKEEDRENGSANESDVDSDSERVSIFELLAFINYLDPDENIIDRVILALYIAHVGESIDHEQAALIHYGSESAIPKPLFVYFFGKDIDARISFDNPGGSPSWTDSGAVAMLQYGL